MVLSEKNDSKAITGTYGGYTFNLYSGNYDFYFVRDNYKTEIRKGITVPSGYIINMDDSTRIGVVYMSPGQSIPLFKGWNLISFQVAKCFFEGSRPELLIFNEDDRDNQITFEQKNSLVKWLNDKSTSPIRSDANPEEAGDWQRITSFDEQGAHILDKSLPSYINTLRYLSVGYGYWIKMNENGVLKLEGNFIRFNTALHLMEGWNLVGVMRNDNCYGTYSSSVNICPYKTGVYQNEAIISYNSLPKFFQNLKDNFSSIKAINGFDSYGATMYNRTLPVYINTLRYIGPKYGYWINVDQEMDIVIDDLQYTPTSY